MKYETKQYLIRTEKKPLGDDHFYAIERESFDRAVEIMRNKPKKLNRMELELYFLQPTQLVREFVIYASENIVILETVYVHNDAIQVIETPLHSSTYNRDRYWDLERYIHKNLEVKHSLFHGRRNYYLKNRYNVPPA